MDDRGDAVRKAFVEQAEWCSRLGAPFTATLCRTLGEVLDDGTLVGQLVLGWQGPPGASGDALPLRLAGGLHALVRHGRLPRLAELYPPNHTPSAARLASALKDSLAEAAAELRPWLQHPPQTNEVGRSTLLMGGLLVLAAAYARPFALFELGASAGLNLLLDRYHHRVGGLSVGDPASPLVLAPRWTGADPPRAVVRIGRRRGVDLQPLDPTREADRERLLAYVWPEQKLRGAQLATALALAAGDPPPLDRGDAAEWTEELLAPNPEPGVHRVLLHSIAFHHFSPEAQARILERVRRVGAAATTEGPFAWLRYELDPSGGGLPTLRLTDWPGGLDRVLATGHPHGQEVDWRHGVAEPAPSGAGQDRTSEEQRRSSIDLPTRP